LLGLPQLADLLRTHFGEGVRAKSPEVAHLLQPITGEGHKNAGSYKAASTLRALMPNVSQVASISTPLTAEQKARQLVEREPDILKELETIEARKVFLNQELTRIAKAREVLANLDNL
jgi:hypothetical protein